MKSHLDHPRLFDSEEYGLCQKTCFLSLRRSSHPSRGLNYLTLSEERYSLGFKDRITTY